MKLVFPIAIFVLVTDAAFAKDDGYMKAFEAIDTLQHALENDPSGKIRSIGEQAEANTHTVKIIRTVRDNRGRPCRDYERTLNYVFETKVTGRACRDSMGAWVITKENLVK